MLRRACAMLVVVAVSIGLLLANVLTQVEALPPLPPPPPPSAPEAIAVAPPPVLARGCAQPSGPYCHDGFYDRFGLGLGYASISGRGPRGDISFSGSGLALSGELGWTVGHGFVLGLDSYFLGGSGSLIGGPHGAATASGTLIFDLGLIADWFPDPENGLHFGGGLGLGLSGIFAIEGAATGLGASLEGGYDWWVASQLSVGVFLRASMTTPGPTQIVDPGLRVETWKFALPPSELKPAATAIPGRTGCLGGNERLSDA